MDNKESILSEKTMVKIPVPMAITICLGLIGFGGGYYKIVSTTDTVETLEKSFITEQTLNREERENIKKESENDDEKM